MNNKFKPELTGVSIEVSIDISEIKDADIVGEFLTVGDEVSVSGDNVMVRKHLTQKALTYFLLSEEVGKLKNSVEDLRLSILNR